MHAKYFLVGPSLKGLHAAWSGVNPSLFWTSRPAPCSTNSWTMSRNAYLHAVCKGVNPSLSTRWRSAPFSRNNLATSTSEATCNAVHPNHPLPLTSAPCSRRNVVSVGISHCVVGFEFPMRCDDDFGRFHEWHRFSFRFRSKITNSFIRALARVPSHRKGACSRMNRSLCTSFPIEKNTRIDDKTQMTTVLMLK